MDTRLVWDIVCKIRETSPLVHNITNFVAMNNTANGLLALGASPIMAHAGAELEDLLDLASALVLNIGTLSEEWGATMIRAAKLAARRNLPVVVDPVGAGASSMRTQLALALIEFSARGPWCGAMLRKFWLFVAAKPIPMVWTAEARPPKPCARPKNWPWPENAWWWSVASVTSLPTARAPIWCTAAMP